MKPLSAHFLVFVGAFFCCWSVPRSAHADPAIPAEQALTLVTRLEGTGVDPEALQRALAHELNRPVERAGAPRSTTVSVEGSSLSAVRIAFSREGAPAVERSVDLSSSEVHTTETIALVAANLVRDEAGELLAQAARSEARATGTTPGNVVAATPTRESPVSARCNCRGPAKPVSVALLFGYGVNVDNASGLSRWGFGFGARGGYNLDKMYFGARFSFYLGGSQSVGLLGGAKTSENSWELGLEEGYDAYVAKGLAVRPLFGLGFARANFNTKATGIAPVNASAYSTIGLFLAAGAALLYDTSDNIFIGVDSRFQIIVGDGRPPMGLLFLANGGMRF